MADELALAKKSRDEIWETRERQELQEKEKAIARSDQSWAWTLEDRPLNVASVESHVAYCNAVVEQMAKNDQRHDEFIAAIQQSSETNLKVAEALLEIAKSLKARG